MNAEKVVAHLLKSNADVTALVSTRIYDTLASEGAAEPFVVFGLDAAEPTVSLTGRTGQDKATVRVEYHGKNIYQLNNLAIRIRAALDHQSGSIAGVTVQGVFWQDQQSSEDDQGYTGLQIYNVYTA